LEDKIFRIAKVKISIRQELPADHSVVFTLIKSAFAKESFSDQKEHFLVQKLRSSSVFIPELSLVAEIDDIIVGHILITAAKIKNHQVEFDSLVLAPVSVLPAYQGKGIGGQLIVEAHSVAIQLEYKSVLLLGHKDYYPRFGYKPAHTFGISFPFDAAPEYCQAVELVEDGLKGVSGKALFADAFFD